MCWTCLRTRGREDYFARIKSTGRYFASEDSDRDEMERYALHRWSGEAVHACPITGDGGLTPCCNRTPFELPHTDRITEDPDAVTCDGPFTIYQFGVDDTPDTTSIKDA